MFFLVLLIDAITVNALYASSESLKEKSFSSLLRSKALEASSAFFSDSKFLTLVLDEHGPKSEEIICKFRDQELSRRNLKRMTRELQDKWISTVLSSETTIGLARRSGGAGPGADLHLTDSETDELDVDGDALKDDDLNSVPDVEVPENFIFNSETLDQILDFNPSAETIDYIEFDNQNGKMGLQKRMVPQSSFASFRDMIYIYTVLIYTKVLQVPLDFTINLISSISLKLSKAMVSIAAEDPDIVQAMSQLQGMMNNFQSSMVQQFSAISKDSRAGLVYDSSRTITRGILDEVASSLPPLSSILIVSVLFVAVPALIALIARLIWNLFQNHDYD